MSEIIIRESSIDDVPEIHSLILELAEFEDSLNYVSVTQDDLKRDGFGFDPLFKSIVAEVNDKICGTAIYFYSYSTWSGKCLYLEDLIIKRNIRAQGIGTALMQTLVKIAEENDAKRMAWQVLDWNVDAQDFYKRFGASIEQGWLNVRLNKTQINSISSR